MTATRAVLARIISTEERIILGDIIAVGPRQQFFKNVAGFKKLSQLFHRLIPPFLILFHLIFLYIAGRAGITDVIS